jgi:Co/Zn/Cd efflux system component
MTDHCCSPAPADSRCVDRGYRRALWLALAINAAMFGVELGGSFAAGSVALLADAADFLGDAANYGISLSVLSLGLAWRARAALVKGVSMGIYGIGVLVKAGWAAAAGLPPEPITMGAIALLALAANVGVAMMLYAYRGGDANMRSVWLCTRNDAIGNVAVLVAALGVFGTASVWPDLAVAAIMAALALHSSLAIVKLSWREVDYARAQPLGPQS